ncbi:hypothetical protein [Streptomyces sp. RFCAC02]|uniref:hypothetical protein n=1 Tax=Streptomyces sp. RFCAC02 TaxID=2499143 RepID=UPI00101E9F3A|nr:hypothetical protein [Streptomyces sp. RFCAC02]
MRRPRTAVAALLLAGALAACGGGGDGSGGGDGGDRAAATEGAASPADDGAPEPDGGVTDPSGTPDPADDPGESGDSGDSGDSGSDPGDAGDDTDAGERLTEEQEEYLEGRVPDGTDPDAILGLGTEACDRLGYLQRHDPDGVAAAVREGEIPGAEEAVAHLCPEYAELLEDEG